MTPAIIYLIGAVVYLSAVIIIIYETKKAKKNKEGTKNDFNKR